MFCAQCGTQNPDGARFCTQCGHGLAESAAGTKPVFAGFWIRVGASLIDSFILSAINMIFFIVFGISAFGMAIGSGGRPEAVVPMLTNVFVLWLFIIGAQWLYCALFESSARQATPGKLAVRIKVTDLNGARISFARATGRYFGEWVTGMTLGIGYLMVAFTKKRQALHDIIADTVVVDAQAEPAQVIHAGPARRMSGWGIAAIVLVLSLMPLGIIAAIAIPAYHDYTIRAQVSEGLMIASDYKGAVRAHFEETGEWPADLTEIGNRFDLLKRVNRSRYVQSIEVTYGTIMITYGRNANAIIDDYMLSLRPHEAADGGVVWQCGNADPPLGVEPESAEEFGEQPESDLGVTSLEDKYMPASCRTGFSAS